MSEIIVKKHGSSVVQNENGIGLDQNKIESHMLNHKRLRDDGYNTVEVASGAVVAGREVVVESGRNLDIFDNRSLAKLGTSRQIRNWANAGHNHNILVSQILATHDEIDDKAEGSQIILGVHEDLERGILTVLNENNAASSTELNIFNIAEQKKVSGLEDDGADNDWMAAHFAISLGATMLFFLTDRMGFEVNDKIMPTIKTYDIPDMISHCQGTSENGTGGMGSKLRAAGKAADAGIHVVIGNAFVDSRSFLDGEGTTVVQ